MPFVAAFFTAFGCAALRFRFAILESTEDSSDIRRFALKVRLFL
jgi:hypothetical protein